MKTIFVAIALTLSFSTFASEQCYSIASKPAAEICIQQKAGKQIITAKTIKSRCMPERYEAVEFEPTMEGEFAFEITKKIGSSVCTPFNMREGTRLHFISGWSSILQISNPDGSCGPCLLPKFNVCKDFRPPPWGPLTMLACPYEKDPLPQFSAALPLCSCSGR